MWYHASMDLLPDRTEDKSRSYEAVDSARALAKTQESVGWTWPESLPALAHNLRATAAILTRIAHAVEMEEDEGKEALRILLKETEEPYDDDGS